MVLLWSKQGSVSAIDRGGGDDVPSSISSGGFRLSETDGTRGEKPGSKILVKNNRLAKLEAILISRERVFDLLATITTAIFTVVLALSTVFLGEETKDQGILPSSKAKI